MVTSTHPKQDPVRHSSVRPSERGQTGAPRGVVLLRPDPKTLADTRNVRPDVQVELWDWAGGPVPGIDAQDPFERANSLPAVLEESPHLEWLSLPSRLAYLLRPRHLQGVKNLHFSGEGVADLRAVDLPVPIRALGGYKVTFKLDEKSFPDLESLDLRITKAGHVDRVLARFPKVRELLVSPARAEQLRSLPARLEALHLVNGDVADLSCLSHLSALRLLQLNNLPKLRSVESLVALQDLEEVMVAYCPELDARPFLQCPRLRFMTALGVPSISAVKAQLGEIFVSRGGSADI